MFKLRAILFYLYFYYIISILIHFQKLVTLHKEKCLIIFNLTFIPPKCRIPTGLTTHYDSTTKPRTTKNCHLSFKTSEHVLRTFRAFRVSLFICKITDLYRPRTTNIPSNSGHSLPMRTGYIPCLAYFLP